MQKKYTEWELVQNNAVFDVWDIVDVNEWKAGLGTKSAKDRFEELKSLIPGMTSFNLISCKYINSWSEAIAFYDNLVEFGYEGAVLKNMNSIWKNTTSTEIIKLKPVYVAEFKVKGWYKGDENNYFQDGIGGLIVESSDGYEFKVGGGFKREERGLELVDPNNENLGLKVIDGFDFNNVFFVYFG